MSEANLLAELALLYNHTEDDSRQFTRWQMVVAIQHGLRLASTAQAQAEIARLKARVEELEGEARNIMPYLDWCLGPESAAHHPTMPGAVTQFRAALKGTGK